MLVWMQPVQAALRLKVRFGEFERSIAVADFAMYAESGQAPPELAWYLNRINAPDPPLPGKMTPLQPNQYHPPGGLMEQSNASLQRDGQS